MKSIYIFALLLFSISLVSATDCWQLTDESGEYECFYLSFEDCSDTYYDEYLDCERERLTILLKTDNFIQKFIEKVAPNYESERLTKLYDLSNFQLLFIALFIYLVYWMIDNK